MKKYLAAGAVAVTAFAFAASAAQLNVTAETLQVGQTVAGELKCTTNAKVVAWGYNDHLDGGPVNQATIQLDNGHTCDGDRLYLSVLGTGDAILSNTSVPLVGGVNTYTLGIPSQAAISDATLSTISGADIEGVRIAIDQGW